jgi:hypothetical protein
MIADSQLQTRDYTAGESAPRRPRFEARRD